ncbi:MAG TPA: YfcE family phosphodiesterase [Anaerolineae bacterium]|nr:YfcE family phosphodiesterase [Anaerolineae bacterium]
MTTLGIITDTHVPQRLKILPPRVWDVFRGVDRILHAGDISSLQVLQQLTQIAPVEAVAGNADLFKHGLPLTRMIEVEGRRIGLVHGHGGWSRYLRSKVRDRFGYNEEHYLRIVHGSFGPVDAIVFGHTHRFYQAERAGILLFNPGPVAPDFYNTPGPQVGLLHVTPHALQFEIAAV